ncbi:MAG: hypothetical protein EBR67_09400, partial [Proteobacteria bacterium]|nr:hypothetical protein [Pseudomonadota bacterium]
IFQNKYQKYQRVFFIHSERLSKGNRKMNLGLIRPVYKQNKESDNLLSKSISLNASAEKAALWFNLYSKMKTETYR